MAVDLHPDIIRAIRGVSGTRTGRRYDRFARRRYGVRGSILAAKTVAGESGGRHNAVSSAGARGEGQFMPETRRHMIDAYGVDPWAGPKQAVKALELYQLENNRGVEGYNPGMPTYKNYILGQQLEGSDARALRSGNQGGSAVSGMGGFSVRGPGRTDVGLAQHTIPGQSFAPERQAARAQLLLGGGKLDIQKLLDYKQTVNSLKDIPSRKVQGDIVVRRSGGQVFHIGQTKGDERTQGSKGSYVMAPGANKPGTSLAPIQRAALRRLSATAGHTLHVGTGTNHNQYVTGTNRVSDHFDGHAADIPASGQQLTKLGQQALIAFGMPARQARRTQGGLFNLNWHGHRVQVIFNSNEGGNHFNHLHVGAR